MKKRGLGRGLDALLGAGRAPLDADPGNKAAQSALENIPVELIQRGRYQPRRDFNMTALQELADSIRVRGLIQPIVVRVLTSGNYEIVAGERRWRAAQMAGLKEVPALVREIPDEHAVAIALIENIQREDLNAIEQAIALQRLQQEFSLTHEQIAEALGKSRTSITNTLRLLSLQKEVRAMLERRELEMGHGRALLGLAENRQLDAAIQISKRGLSVREAEALVRKILAGSPAKKPGQNAGDADLRLLERELSEITGAAISIRHGSKGKGRLVINYSNLEQLDGILERLRNS